MSDAMNAFLTKENLDMHREYLRDLNLRYSIIEKSEPTIKGKSLSDILGMRIDIGLKSDIMRLKNEINLHKCYFSSFSLNAGTTKSIIGYYSSDADFRYRVLCAARDTEGDFVCISKNRYGVPQIYSASCTCTNAISVPALALDVCEHAYFYDYGFNRAEYLKRAISHLDLSLLDN